MVVDDNHRYNSIEWLFMVNEQQLLSIIFSHICDNTTECETDVPCCLPGHDDCECYQHALAAVREIMELENR